jgi:hypothetical protein
MVYILGLPYMRIKKIIEVGLRINDYLTAAGSLNESLMLILRQRYENRCYCSCLIKKILRIVKHGPLIIDPVSASRANVSVKFEVEAVVFVRGEVIVGCKVERRDTTKLITCTVGDAIVLAEDSILDSMKEGQYTPLEAVETQYPIMTNTIATSAVPFLPPADKPAYVVAGQMTEHERELLSDLIAEMHRAESEAGALRAANSRGYEFFENQLYPFKQQSAPEGAKIITIADMIKEITKSSPGESNIESKVISRDAHLGYTSDKLAVWDASKVPEGITVYTQYSPYKLAIILLTEYIDALRVIREMIEVYNTPELIKSHVGLWLMFKTAKK